MHCESLLYCSFSDMNTAPKIEPVKAVVAQEN